MRILSKMACVAILSFTIAAMCGADTLSDGRALYKAGKYDEAITKLERATREEPNNAKAWWQLNFAYNKAGRFTDALSAVKKAGQIDPKHGFASDPGKYKETLDRLQEKSGAPISKHSPKLTSPRAGSARQGYGGDNITRALLNGDVYIEPGMSVDADRLAQTAQSLRPAVVKFVVLNKDVRGSRLAADAKTLRQALNLGDGYVVLGTRGGVAVSSKLLNVDTEKRLVQQYEPQMAAGNYTDGLVGLAQSLVVTKHKQTEQSTAMWVFLGVAVIAIIVLWVIIASLRKAQAMDKLRKPIELQKGEVVTQMNSLENQMAGLDANTAAKVREARATAGSRLDEAARILVRAKTEQDLSRAQHLLDQAQADCARGQAAIDRIATGGHTNHSAPKPSPAQPTSNAQTNWSTVDERERGVCFFCSRPSLLSELTPVTVNLGGQQQKVLACYDDLQTVKTGQTPQIRAFNDGGRNVPWYAYQGYDPYNDYYSRGYYNRSLMTDLIMWDMVDSMYWDWRHPVGWGWGGGYGHGYVFYSDHEYYHDYYMDRTSGYGDFGNTDSASADFLQSSGGDFDPNVGGDNIGTDQS